MSDFVLRPVVAKKDSGHLTRKQLTSMILEFAPAYEVEPTSSWSKEAAMLMSYDEAGPVRDKA